MKRLTAYLFLLLAFAACSGRNTGLERDLSSLDELIAVRDRYDALFQDRVALMKDRDGASFDGCMALAAEYFSFSFDSTRHYLLRCWEMADREGDPIRRNQAAIDLGRLYTTAGHYIEAYTRLFNEVDTTALTPELRKSYLSVLYQFEQGVRDAEGTVSESMPDLPEEGVIGDALLSLAGADSPEGRRVLFDRYLNALELEKADSVSFVMLRSVPENSHDYALYAYLRSMAMEYQGRYFDRLSWLSASAKADIVNSVKDYASITTLSQLLIQSDPVRSFRYLRLAQEDALTYGSNLRSVQISRFFLDIEKAYEARLQRSRWRLLLINILLIVLSVALIAALYNLVNRSLRLSATRRELEERNTLLTEANARLQDLNAQISAASRLKEEYIGLFFNMLSENIDRMVSHDNSIRNHLKQGQLDEAMKEVSGFGKKSEALDELLRTFDSTFLTLFPTFIEEFNALLDEEGRSSAKKGEILSTEQRVYALIRLGIDDSTKIAAFLHNSLSTVYNYKVRVRNHAVIDRERFEDAVKQIGQL